MKIKINSYIPITRVEGPDIRFAIWTQGCSIQCRGCANKHMWDKNLGQEYETDELVGLIKAYKDKIDGITILGGEPLDQMEPVAEIAQKTQELGLSVIIFTGYKYENLKNNELFRKLAKYTDILIDGEFDESKTDYSRPWVGSSNQNYYFLSDRYNENILKEFKNKFEIKITKNNKITINGMGDFKKLRKRKVIKNAAR